MRNNKFSGFVRLAYVIIYVVTNIDNAEMELFNALVGFINAGTDMLNALANFISAGTETLNALADFLNEATLLVSLLLKILLSLR